MSNSRQIEKPDEQSVWTTTATAALAALLLILFAIAYWIGTSGYLANEAQGPMPPIAITALAPVGLFLIAYGSLPAFRDFVLAQDLRTLTMLQHWRVIGFAFLPIYSFGLLPGLFAWPAGLGDLAIGLAAPFVVLRMDRNPQFQGTAGFLRFHLLGLLDFAVAVAAAALSAGAFPGLIADGITSAQMDVWPLNIFPSLFVPVFIIDRKSVV